MNNKQVSTDTVSVKEWLQRDETQVRLGHALGGSIGVKEFAAQLSIELMNPKYRGIDDANKMKCAAICASLGLLPTLNQVALIPRNGELTVMPQWQGYKSLMERSPNILEVNAYLVHKDDTYDIVDNKIIHKFDPFGRDIEGLNDLKGGYLVIKYADRTRDDKHVFATARYIEKCMSCAQTKGVWNKWFEQMALKTVYRSAWARREVPVDTLSASALNNATEAEDAALQNDPSRPRRIEAKSRVDDLIATVTTRPDMAGAQVSAEPLKVVQQQPNEAVVVQPAVNPKPKAKPKAKAKVKAKAKAKVEPEAKAQDDEIILTVAGVVSQFSECGDKSQVESLYQKFKMEKIDEELMQVAYEAMQTRTMQLANDLF